MISKFSRVVIEHVRPEIDAGRFPVKRTPGESVDVTADIYADGHDAVAAILKWRYRGDSAWTSVPMQALPNDRWTASFVVAKLGIYEYMLEARLERGAPSVYERTLQVRVERERARYGAWYEMFRARLGLRLHAARRWGKRKKYFRILRPWVLTWCICRPYTRLEKVFVKDRIIR